MYIQTKRPKGSSTSNWLLEYEASPGNLGPLEDIIYSSNDNIDSRGLIAIKLQLLDERVNVGVVFVDELNQNIHVGEFEDNNYLSNLEGLLVQLGPKECLTTNVPSNLVQRLEIIVGSSKILLTETSPSFFADHDLDQLKYLLVKPADIDVPLDQSILSMKSN